MNEKSASFLPFHAINEFMRDDYRQKIVQTVLARTSSLSGPLRGHLQSLIKRQVQVPGFRNSTLAPTGVKLRPTASAFEKHPDLAAAILSAWSELNPDLQSRVYEILKEREWELLPPDADRTKLPGFLTAWPQGEDFEGLNHVYREKYPESEETDDDISLMVVWLSNRLPFSNQEE